jgi:rhomboid protease GluP
MPAFSSVDTAHVLTRRSSNVSVIAVVILLGVVAYVLTPAERARFVRAVTAFLRRLWHKGAQSEPLVVALKSRTRYPFVTVALIGLNTLVFICMLFGSGALSDPRTLVGWGANFPPLTTNGQWWRLVTMLFVHVGMWHLLATFAGLAPLGVTLERLVGPIAFFSVYLASGAIAGVVSVSSTPVSVSAGASGAIFGLYGLLASSLIWAVVNRPAVRIPLALVNTLGVAATAFALYNLWTDALGVAAETAGFATGFVGGILMSRGVVAHKPPVGRIARAATAALVISVLWAIPLRGLSDARPVLSEVLAFERRTTGEYAAAVDRFKTGSTGPESLAQLIQGTILPQLHVAQGRLETVGKIPPEQQRLVIAAAEYFELREKSWQLRMAALTQRSMPALREAEDAERGALEALKPLKTADQK